MYLIICQLHVYNIFMALCLQKLFSCMFWLVFFAAFAKFWPAGGGSVKSFERFGNNESFCEANGSVDSKLRKKLVKVMSITTHFYSITQNAKEHSSVLNSTFFVGYVSLSQITAKYGKSCWQSKVTLRSGIAEMSSGNTPDSPHKSREPSRHSHTLTPSAEETKIQFRLQ